VGQLRRAPAFDGQWKAYPLPPEKVYRERKGNAKRARRKKNVELAERKENAGRASRKAEEFWEMAAAFRDRTKERITKTSLPAVIAVPPMPEMKGNAELAGRKENAEQARRKAEEFWEMAAAFRDRTKERIAKTSLPAVIAVPPVPEMKGNAGLRKENAERARREAQELRERVAKSLERAAALKECIIKTSLSAIITMPPMPEMKGNVELAGRKENLERARRKAQEFRERSAKFLERTAALKERITKTPAPAAIAVPPMPEMKENAELAGRKENPEWARRKAQEFRERSAKFLERTAALKELITKTPAPAAIAVPPAPGDDLSAPS